MVLFLSNQTLIDNIKVFTLTLMTSYLIVYMEFYGALKSRQTDIPGYKTQYRIINLSSVITLLPGPCRLRSNSPRNDVLVADLRTTFRNSTQSVPEGANHPCPNQCRSLRL